MPKKTYTDELAEWIAASQAKIARSDENLVLFLALKDDVKDAIELGYSKKTIWQHLTETNRLSCSYSTFRRYVENHISGVKPKKASATTPKKKASGFHFDPSASTKDLF